MGYEVHITMAQDWPDSAEAPITADAWNSIVSSDTTLEPAPDFYFDESTSLGPKRIFAVRWLGHPEDEDVMLWFADGRITVKGPDDATISKLLELTERLDAHLVGDDGEIYRRSTSGSGWETDYL